ncbi:hypothetical protein CK247_30220, partial [Klebsiella pneumoniae]
RAAAVSAGASGVSAAKRASPHPEPEPEVVQEEVKRSAALLFRGSGREAGARRSRISRSQRRISRKARQSPPGARARGRAGGS